MEQIDSGEIHLWLASCSEITDPRLLAEYQELQKQRRFHFERDRHRYLVTRAMVRTVLSKYAAIAPHDWRFAINPYGRPSIVPELTSAGRIEFNVSHTDHLVVLGVACERVIGVDVENVRARVIDLQIADRYFAREEVAALRALPQEQQQQRFFEYWTLKESYIKARGMRLSIPLDRFAFELGKPGGIRLSVDPSLQDCAERWTFWQWPVARDCVAAVCAENVGAAQAHLASARCWLST